MKFSTVRRFRWLALVLGFAMLGSSAWAQSDAAADRRIKNRVVPVYPELAKNLKLSSTVKVQVSVAPNGAVTQAKALGGHPLLVGPAVDAAKMWRYEPSGGATTQVIEFHFGPSGGN